MGFTFDFDKFKKHDPRDYSDYMDDEFDYEYAEEFIFENILGMSYIGENKEFQQAIFNIANDIEE